MSLDGHLSSPDVTTRLKRPTRKQTGRLMLSVRSCFEWGLQCPFCYQKGGSLLHCLSTLTGRTGGLFLLHCLWSRLRQTLSGILPCEARTFLSHGLSVPWQRPSVLLANATYSIILFLKCLYPIITSTTILSMIHASSMDATPHSSTGSRICRY